MNERTRTKGESNFDVVWPLGRLVSPPVERAPAVLDLNGKTVCEFWDSVFRGDEMYAVVNEDLRKRYPGIKIVDHVTMGATHGTNEREVVASIPDLLRKHGADAVISGVGA